MQGFIVYGLYVTLLLLLVIVTNGSRREQSKSNFLENADEVLAINVTQGGDNSQRNISLHVTTSSRVFTFELQNVPSVLDRDVGTISITADQTNQLTYSFENIDPDVHHVDSLFFHNPQTGSVLSVEILPNERHIVEGFLDHNTIIVPANHNVRDKRATKPPRHTLYSVEERPDFEYKNENWKKLGSEQILINSLLKNDFDSLYSKDALIQHLIDSHRDIDTSEEENEDSDDDDDYKEVPSFFDTEEAWKAHQRQSVVNTNLVRAKDDNDNNNSDQEKMDIFKFLKTTLTKEPSQTFGTFYSPLPESKEADAILSRLKRHTSNEDAELDHDNENVLFHEQGRKLLSSGVTEPFLKQMTTLEIPLQIPRPFTNDIWIEGFLSKEMESQGITKLKHLDKKSTTGKLETEVEYDETVASGKSRRKRQIPIEMQPGRVIERNFGKTVNSVKPQKGKFTIEVHVVVDASLYQDFNYNWKTLQLFLLHFWQSVNSRFQALASPHVQLKIKAISKIMFPGFQPFIENNRVDNSSNWVDVDRVLEDFRSYVQEHFELNPLVPDHDVAFLMTGEDLCKRKANNSWSKKSRGIAFVRGACISARRFQSETYDVGISEVGRSFSGVLTTTHELAHLVGAFHDGEKNSLSCPSTAGYIMGEAWNEPVKFNQFSQCSKTNMKSFLETAWYANCLVESVDHKNSVTYTFPQRLPGQVFSLEEQCYHFIEGLPCTSVPLSGQCGQLCCEKWSQVFKSREPAADGTRCGEGKICDKGQCIKKTNR